MKCKPKENIGKQQRKGGQRTEMDRELGANYMYNQVKKYESTLIIQIH